MPYLPKNLMRPGGEPGYHRLPIDEAGLARKAPRADWLTLTAVTSTAFLLGGLMVGVVLHVNGLLRVHECNQVMPEGTLEGGFHTDFGEKPPA